MHSLRNSWFNMFIRIIVESEGPIFGCHHDPTQYPAMMARYAKLQDVLAIPWRSLHVLFRVQNIAMAAGPSMKIRYFIS